MTVKEMLAMLADPNEVNLSWNGDRVYFNFRNKIEIDVWGDFMVNKVFAEKEGVFELVLAAQPVKKEVLA